MRAHSRIAAALPLVLLVVMPARARSADDPGYSVEGEKACLDCHETPEVMGILDTPHFDASKKDSPAAQHQCQSCHGPSKRHMQFPMQVENLHFGKKSTARAQLQNTACLECHDTGEQSAWSTSAHGYEEVLCSHCHKAHDAKSLLPRGQQVETTCTDSCHTDLMGTATPASFSHRVGANLDGRGALTCAGCHNPHGPLDSTRCADCHDSKPATLAKQSEKARRYHETALDRGTECVRCHKEIDHPIKDPEIGRIDRRIHTGVRGFVSTAPR